MGLATRLTSLLAVTDQLREVHTRSGRRHVHRTRMSCGRGCRLLHRAHGQDQHRRVAMMHRIHAMRRAAATLRLTAPARGCIDDILNTQWRRMSSIASAGVPPVVDAAAAGAASGPAAQPRSAKSSKPNKGNKPSWAPLKGLHDSSPASVARHRSVESSFARVCESFQYGEVRTPILERTDLFVRTLGDTSDVVSKEMFLFDDHGTSTVLRPEATASVARALLAEGIGSLPVPTRLWYSGPMFRRERPQAGRQRQFSQFGVECVGSAEVGADAETIEAAAECLRAVGLLPYVTLQVNSLGDAESRAAYVTALGEFLRARMDRLSAESRARLERGSVLRILDSKDAGDQALLRGTAADNANPEPAPTILEYLSPASSARFSTLQQRLTSAGVLFTVNPFLVRGLDYYSHTAFEFVIDPASVAARLTALARNDVQVPAQSTVLAGGRYDGLFASLGGPTVPAVGWAAGVERILLLQDIVQAHRPAPARPMPVGVVLIDEDAKKTNEASQSASDAAAGTPTIAAAYSALCTYIRRGCALDSHTTTSASSSTTAPSSLPSHALYSVVRSFHPSASKQLKSLTKVGVSEFASSSAADLQLVLLVGEEEVRHNLVKVKSLTDGEQRDVPLAQLAELMRRRRRQTSAETVADQAQTTDEPATLTYAALCDAARG